MKEFATLYLIVGELLALACLCNPGGAVLMRKLRYRLPRAAAMWGLFVLIWPLTIVFAVRALVRGQGT